MSLTLCVALLSGALAAPTDDEAESPPPGDESAVGGRPPPLAREPRSAEQVFQLPADLTMQQYADLPLPYLAYTGATMLSLDPEFVHGVQTGLGLLYLRKYGDAKEHFASLETSFPGTSIRSVGDTLVWQALMLENFDYRYDKQYWVSTKQARRDLDIALSTAGNEAWDHLVMAAIVGIESIHTMRQGSYLNALQLAFQAMDHIEKCRTAAPNFVDLKLADGMYNYWRSVITMNSKVLPDFGDHRVEGIEQMQVVEDAGVFVAPLATLSLAFTWIEERDLKRAASACGSVSQTYPDNIINNLVYGSVFLEMRRYDDALARFEKVLAVDPNNARVHYYKGLAFVRSGNLDGAKTEFETYLAVPQLEPYQRSYAHFRLGQVLGRQEQFVAAVENYKAAIKIDGHKGSKAAIDRLETRKKEGKISY